MSIKIASWNIEGRLSPYATRGRGTPDRIVDEIEALDADVVILPEAYDKSKGVSSIIEKRIYKLGYGHIFDVEYSPGGPPRTYSAVDEPYIRVMSRLPFDKTEIIRPGGLRNMADVTVTDPATGKQLRIIGVHFEDRNETFRLRQVDGLVRLINNSKTELVVQGDMNAMFGHHKRAQFMKSGLVKTFAMAMPGDVLSDFLARASDMATGSTLDMLISETTLRDVDKKHQFTATPKVRDFEWLPSIPLIDIDHALVTPGITVTGFQVGKHDKGSDHRSISEELSLK